MKVSRETNLNEFNAWSGAKENLAWICDNNYDERLQALIEELYPDGIDATELNDLLWFDFDTIVHEWLGVKGPYDEDEAEENEN